MDVTVKYCERKEAVEVGLNRENGFQTITYSSEDVRLSPRGEAAVAGLLLVAMAAGEDMRVDSQVDPAFMDKLPTIQDIYATWGEGLSRIDVQSEGAEGSPAATTEGKTATFFSGGVDSFYTFLKNKNEIDALIFVHGFDLSLDESALRTTVSRKLREVADAYDKRLIEVETTLRSVTEQNRFTPEFANWELSHGSALASVAHVLGDQFDRIYIPATHTYDLIFPFGSHPLLDPLWSNHQLTITQSGCEAGRVAKCEFIAKHDYALDALRVCWKNPKGGYNCGQCEKCIRTKLILRSIGVLGQCGAFNEGLSISDVSTVWIKKGRWERYYEDILEYMEGGGDRKLRYAIKYALHYSRLKRAVRKVLR